MPPWLRRTLGILPIAGGGTGIATTLAQLMHTSGLFLWILGTVVIAMFAYGIYCGTTMLEGRNNAVRENSVFWLLQVPVLATGLIGYVFGCGCMAVVWLRLSQPFDLSIDLSGNLGAAWNFSLFHPQDLRLGVNVFALAIVLLLRRFRTQRPGPVGAPPEPA